MTIVIEALPGTPLADEIVLHVRKHTRRSLRRGEGTVAMLALLFGLPPDKGAALSLAEALRESDPERAAADRIARSQTPTSDTVALGHLGDHLRDCVSWLRERKRAELAYERIIATDPATLLVLSKAIELANARAPADVQYAALPLVIQGDTGTGKELLARAIHEIWKRACGAVGGFHPLDVAGLPREQISDELFGHARGAFTDAKNERKGRIEDADGGTLFIDEVGDLPNEAQVRLLRFLQDGRFSRLGENRVRHAAVRVVAATWRNLDDEVAAGRFRVDLLHRLRGDLLELPKLRDRAHWQEQVVAEMLRSLGHAAVPQIAATAVDALSRATWTGNLRELDAVLRGAVSSAAGATIRVEDLPSRIQKPYHALALHQKACPFLCDAFDGEPLTDSVVRWRIEEVQHAFETVPAPPPPEGIDAIRNFHTSIPDPSPEHQTARGAIDSYVQAMSEEQRLAGVVAGWEQVLKEVPPVVVRDAVTPRLADACGRHDAAVVQLRRSEAAFTMSPWYKFCMEIAELPLFREQHAVTVAQGISFVVGLLYSIEPEWTKKLAALVREGGLAAVRKKLKELLEEAPAKEIVDGASPDYRTLTKEEWRVLLEQFPSKAALARHLAIDKKTLDSRLAKHGVDRRAQRRKAMRRGPR